MVLILGRRGAFRTGPTLNVWTGVAFDGARETHGSPSDALLQSTLRSSLQDRPAALVYDKATPMWSLFAAACRFFYLRVWVDPLVCNGYSLLYFSQKNPHLILHR